MDKTQLVSALAGAALSLGVGQGCAAPDSVAPSPGCLPVDGQPMPDAWGGDTRVDLGGTGAFRTEQVCGRWWFVTPDGHPFYSTGVNTAGPTGDTDIVTGIAPYGETVAATYASNTDWAEATVARLQSWGINTIGAWSDVDDLGPRMPYTVNLSLSGGDWQTGTVADWWDPAWEEAVASTVATTVAPRVGDPRVLGWFLDNEMRWGPDWRGPDTLLELHLALGPEAPGKRHALDALLAAYGSLDGLNAHLGTQLGSEADALAETDWTVDDPDLTGAFQSEMAERWFSVTTDTIRATDPDHLILGNRESAPIATERVLLAAAAHVDVLSLNHYVFVDGVSDAAQAIAGAMDPADGFAALHAAVDMPVLITEFGFRAADAGLPNTWPPIYPIYATQAERADAFATYARGVQAVPWIVGYHWFEWVDEPVNGRFDGEDNNWGLVNVADEPYVVLTERMAEVNTEVGGLLTVP